MPAMGGTLNAPKPGLASTLRSVLPGRGIVAFGPRYCKRDWPKRSHSRRNALHCPAKIRQHRLPSAMADLQLPSDGRGKTMDSGTRSSASGTEQPAAATADDPVYRELTRWGVTTVPELIALVREYLPDADGQLISEAYDFAAHHHYGQYRKSGKPYFDHPVSVAGVLIKLRLDEASVCAGLLHDVVEDCECSLDDLEARFSTDIAHIVDGVTKLDKIPFTRKEHKQAENFRKMLVAMSKDIRVLLIKLADRLHNMSTMQHMKPRKARIKSLETIEIYAPLANRLGIHWMKSQLEDYCFEHLYPEDFKDLKSRVGRRDPERKAYTNRVVRLLKTELARADMVGVRVYGRPKHLFGIYRKMGQQKLPFEQIYDAMGFRIVVQTIEQCYQALGVVHSKFTPIPGRFKDYIALPKANNYRSLHTTVIGPDNQHVEVQIRTMEMHQIAENGVAAHWRYKEKSAAIKTRDEERFTWLKQLMELNEQVSDSDEFLDNMRIDLFNDEVYAFTPAGEVKVFPRGATPVDFAYSIHTRVGETTTGAKVNGQMVTLDTQLRNGDVIEIMTRSDARPNQDWLEFVQTARAKTKIRNSVRREQRARAKDVGNDLLEKAFRRAKHSLTRVQRHDDFDKMLSSFRVQTFDELAIQVGYGKVEPTRVVERLLPDEAAAVEPEPPVITEPKRGRRREGKAAIVVAGIDDVMVRFPRCCSPVPGDDVIGFVTRGRGITVHRRSCPRALDSDPLRQIECAWDLSRGSSAHSVVRVHTGNSAGMLADMTQRFREAGVNILSANCRSVGKRRAISEFEVEVKDISQLQSLLDKLGRLDFVHRVERVGA